ncbi:Uu.00g069460.m01.CDS01 [Anthostomella pinea]|uniref:Uu.00g069460.m01.CDS01 n=1 Tax=Anthostomella pinea TaxID=933095 RepID=A0AAI8VNX3_9PEZI|nr:Uu.00g069460.m01.CDS01 [Anthostomella pinea]
MADDLTPASLRFLSDAAHLLATSAPQTSAHLMIQRNSLMFSHDIPQSDAQRQHVCGSCGHIMISGQVDVLDIESDEARRKKIASQGKSVKKDEPRKGCRKRVTCGSCGSYTKINLPPANAITRRRLKQSSRFAAVANTPSISTPSNHSPAPPLEVARPSANASSKKRAKNRKQGLQALLQQSSNAKPSVGLGLSLADFMKK